MFRTTLLWWIVALLCNAGCDQKKTKENNASAACETARKLFEQGTQAYDGKAFAQADSFFRSAAQVAQVAGCKPDMWAQCRLEMARTIRRSDRQFGASRAIDTLLKDLAYVHAVHPELAGRFYFHIAYAYRSQEDFWNALTYYEKARLMHESGRIAATVNSGQFLYKPLANIYTRLGETEKALQMLRIALDSSLLQKDVAGVPNIYGDLGWALVDAGYIDSACLQFQRGLDYIRNNRAQNDRADTQTRSMLLSNWAEAQLLLPFPDIDSARQLAVQALALNDANTGALTTLGNIAGIEKQYDLAQEYYQQAESVYSEDPLPLDRERSKLLLKRAKLCLEQTDQPDNEAALRFCQRALQLVLPAFKPGNAWQNPPERLFYPENAILEALDLKSRILWAAYRAHPERQRLALADSTTALALAMNDTLTSIYGFESSKLYSLENTRDLHERYLQILFERHDRWAETGAAEHIAAFLEKSRALLLRQKLAGEYALQAAPIPPALRQQEDDTRRELIYLKNELAAEEAYEDPDPDLVAQLQSGIFRVQEARQLLMDSLKTAFPEYFEARYARPIATLSDIRAMLPGDSSLFAEYFFNPETGALYALGIARHTVKLFRGTLSAANLEAFLFFVQDENMGLNREGDPAFLQQFVQEARMLYDTLLAPLAGKMPLRELIISPDGSLGSLPFDLLLPREPLPAEQTFRRLPYLIRQTRVRFAASATVLREAGALAGRADGSGYFGAAPGYHSDGFFAPVRFGAECVLGLSKSFKGQLVSGTRATRERFCSEAPGFQILHFYGHGSANGSRPELSYLAFAGGKGRGNSGAQSHTLAAAIQLPAEETGHVLFAHEISLLRLHAGLVVLSACETGVGRAAGSEGIFSLARAFQDAGCPSAAMTLWSVDDAATAALTTLFLQNIRAGQPKDMALQKAKLSFLDGNYGSAIPYYWSGMVLTGDAAPLNIRTNGCQIVLGDETVSCALLWLLAGLLVLVGGLVVAIFRR